MSKSYHGKYRATVRNNIDPKLTGRLLVEVPDVTGPVAPASWAEPSFPMAGIQAGAWMIPPVNAEVWVEFQQGDPNHPIWTGSLFGSAAEVPAAVLAAPPGVPNIVLQTTGQNALIISDVPGPTGGIILKSSTGALISINALGITISNGQGASITLTGPSVTINGGALVVT
jgi:uncharacterized protein involved in type VI secretion and phage assembly